MIVDKVGRRRSRKDSANPCETLVLRLCGLQPYAPLRRTRSESAFARLYSPSEHITQVSVQHKSTKKLFCDPPQLHSESQNSFFFIFFYILYFLSYILCLISSSPNFSLELQKSKTLTSYTQYPQDADDAEVHQPSSGSAPPESAGAHSQGTHRSHSHQPH